MTPWNKNKSVGKKKPLTESQVKILRDILTKEKKWMELALFNVAIDTMLRSSDLVTLKVEDVMEGKGKVRETLNIKLQKTSRPHVVHLYKKTQESLLKLITKSQISRGDYLFFIEKPSVHLPTRTYRQLVKKWMNDLYLDVELYSTHSLRRTRPALIYEKTKDLAVVKELLGHSSLGATAAYLNIDNEEAWKVAAEFEI